MGRCAKAEAAGGGGCSKQAASGWREQMRADHQGPEPEVSSLQGKRRSRSLVRSSAGWKQFLRGNVHPETFMRTSSKSLRKRIYGSLNTTCNELGWR